MLLVNFNLTNQRIGRQNGGLTDNLYANQKYEVYKNFTLGEQVNTEIEKTAFPSASYGHYAYVLPIIVGRIASRNSTKVQFVANDISFAQGYNASSTANVVFGTASSIEAIASLSGVSNIVFTPTASISAVAQLAGNSNIVFSALADVSAVASLSGISNILFTTSADNFATADMYGSTDAGQVTAESIAEAVWSALASANNNVGTMGEKLNLAGSGGVDYDALRDAVWAQLIETGYTAEDLLRLMSSVLLGKVSGAGTGLETFRDINDTKDRVESTVDDNGNRTNVEVDAT